MHCLKSATVVLSFLTLLSPMDTVVIAQDQEDPGAINARIRRLQQERVETLQRAADLAQAQYREGTIGFRVVLAARQDLLEARLDMAETREEKAEVLTSQLKLARESLAVAEARYRAARTTLLDVHQAKSALLRVEIRLLKVRAPERPKQSK